MADATMIEEQVEEQAETRRVEARWEVVECTCPEWCERDHEQD